MESTDLGKLFIGGISWDTNEDRLREYFQTFGEVIEAVIMKDRQTGRARGFGFIVFADPAVAERVVLEKHMIDGRTVEAKKAVPRDDQHMLNRSTSSTHGSPGPARTKKIFVGGLASTVTESDFKKYFDQFGTITDVVVMYDHNTQRPRGFGFITFDSEDAVDKVLQKSFHDLNGKLVEVKRAVPKDLSPGPNRSPLTGYNFGMNRMNSFLNGYPQGYNSTSVGGYGMRMDGRFGPIVGGRSGFPTFGPPSYGMGINFEAGLNPNFGGTANFNNNLGFGRGLNPYYGGNSSRYSNAIGHGGGSGGSGSFFSSMGRNVWGNGGFNYSTSLASSTAYIGSGNGSIGGFGNSSANWGSSPSLSAQGGVNSSGFGSGNLGYGSSGNSYGIGGNTYGRSSGGTGSGLTSCTTSNGGYDGAYADLYGSSSVYGDPTWRSASSELEGSGSFGYGLRNAASDVTPKGSTGYISGYNVIDRQPNRGIAT